MTLAARQVLEDCVVAVDSLVDDIQGDEWRRRWVLAIVLLRAVGHVLDKVDGEISPSYRSAIDSWWFKLNESKPEPNIFWQFIDKERNSVIKQYRNPVCTGVTVRVPTVYFDMKTGEHWTVPDPSLPVLYNYSISSGPFEGKDHRDILREAIEWWGYELDTIDNEGGEP
jgi:hypothetical protein